MGEPDVQHPEVQNIVQGLADLFRGDLRRPWRDKTSTETSSPRWIVSSGSDHPTSDGPVHLASNRTEAGSRTTPGPEPSASEPSASGTSPRPRTSAAGTNPARGAARRSVKAIAGAGVPARGGPALR